MKRHSQSERRCSYLVVLDNTSRSIDELRELGAYLSTLAVSDFDVIVVDASFPPTLDCNRRVLRWVGRHILARPQHLGPLGTVDPIRAAVDLASCEKVIVADAHVRYSDKVLEEISMLLDLHEVVEPQDYLDPLPWWGGIEAGRILVHRSLSPLPDHGSTFAFRKRAIRGLRSIAHSATADDYVRRLASQGAEVFSAIEIFVRRIPPALSEWIRDLPRQADEDFEFRGFRARSARANGRGAILPMARMFVCTDLGARALDHGLLGAALESERGSGTGQDSRQRAHARRTSRSYRRVDGSEYAVM